MARSSEGLAQINDTLEFPAVGPQSWYRRLLYEEPQLIACPHCKRHHTRQVEYCPHCQTKVNLRSVTRNAILLGLALASSACDGGSDKAVALYGAPVYPDTGDTGDTAEDSEGQQS